MFSTEVFDPAVPSHSTKLVAESLGISGFSDDVAELLSSEATERLKEILHHSVKFMEKGKRRKLSTEDFDKALKYKNFEPFYGFSAPDFIPFRFASGGGREIFFSEEKEIELNDIINSSNTKTPLEATLKAHWLAIEGVQPAVPENPVTASMTEDGTAKSLTADKKSELLRLRRHELVNVRSLSTHDVSVELQLYYKEVTEGAVGSDETKRMEALNSLANDTGLQPLVPRLVLFISEGVKCNVVQHNLALLIYLMRMVKALTENPAVNMEKCLHDLLPGILSCILGSQLCSRPEADNHWALREFAAKVLVHVSKQYSNHVNSLQSRLSYLLAHCWKNESSSFSTLFGALNALNELGPDTVKNFVLPKISAESEKIRATLEGGAYVTSDRVGADHLKTLLVKVLRNHVKTNAPQLTEVSDFRNEFGFYLGSLVHGAMVQARELPNSGPASTGNVTSSSLHRFAGHSVGYASSPHYRNMPSTPSGAGYSSGGTPQKVLYVRNSSSFGGDPGTPTGSTTPSTGGTSGRFFPAGGPPILTQQGDTATASAGAGQSMVVVRTLKVSQSRSSSPNVAASSPDNQT